MSEIGRTRRAELLAMADRSALIAVAETCLADGFEPGLVIGPEVGMVMLTVREPVESTRLHLGEVLVTRTEVGHLGQRGWSMRMGDDREAAMAAAICDAEAEADGPCAGSVRELLCRAEVRLATERAEELGE